MKKEQAEAERLEREQFKLDEKVIIARNAHVHHKHCDKNTTGKNLLSCPELVSSRSAWRGADQAGRVQTEREAASRSGGGAADSPRAGQTERARQQGERGGGEDAPWSVQTERKGRSGSQGRGTPEQRAVRSAWKGELNVSLFVFRCLSES